ncbi:MAG: exosortase C-terminal domain/associated protein EpsI [Bryobacteraceae bacterium]
MLGFLKRPAARILTVVLLLQAALFYNLSHGEDVPLALPLAEFPREFGGWRSTFEGVVTDEVQAVLRADDTLTRNYADAHTVLNLFIAYFKSQRTGQAPHSPKHCLPGAGWVPTQSEVMAIEVPGYEQPVEVNRYVLAKGPDKSVVFYWYKANQRIIASEYTAKLYLVADAIRYRRTDTALVRVVVPVQGENGEEAATRAGIEFIRAVFPALNERLPS